jgi:hypothetical protein
MVLTRGAFDGLLGAGKTPLLTVPWPVVLQAGDRVNISCGESGRALVARARYVMVGLDGSKIGLLVELVRVPATLGETNALLAAVLDKKAPEG